MEINTSSAGSSAVELYGSFHLGQTELALPGN
jgi:purine-binding chemotaxis protein CheW